MGIGWCDCEEEARKEDFHLARRNERLTIVPGSFAHFLMKKIDDTKPHRTTQPRTNLLTTGTPPRPHPSQVSIEYFRRQPWPISVAVMAGTCPYIYSTCAYIHTFYNTAARTVS